MKTKPKQERSHMSIPSRLQKFRRQKGAPLVEYALLLSLIAVMCWTGTRFMGEGIANGFSFASNQVSSATTLASVPTTPATNPGSTTPTPAVDPRAQFNVDYVDFLDLDRMYWPRPNPEHFRYTLQNMDAYPVVVQAGDLTVSGAGFALENNECIGKTLPPGGQCFVTVVITSSGPGVYIGPLSARGQVIETAYAFR